MLIPNIRDSMMIALGNMLKTNTGYCRCVDTIGFLSGGSTWQHLGWNRLYDTPSFFYWISICLATALASSFLRKFKFQNSIVIACTDLFNVSTFRKLERSCEGRITIFFSIIGSSFAEVFVFCFSWDREHIPFYRNAESSFLSLCEASSIW